MRVEHTRKKAYLIAALTLCLHPAPVFAADTPTAPNVRPGWDQGVTIGKRIGREIQNNPGGKLYGPGQGMTDFQTFEENPDDRRTFSASIHGHNETRYDVGRVEICITNFTNLGLNLLVRSLTPTGDVVSSNTYNNVGGIASYGLAVCNLPTNNLGDDCTYYRWNFNRGNKTIALDATTANQTSFVNGRPLHQALGAMSCLNVGCDPNVVNMNVYNYDMLLNTIATGALQSIRETAPEYIPTVSQTSDGVGHCLQYSITSVVKENTTGTATENTCWDGAGNVVNCESIQRLQERAANMGGILNQSEVRPYTQREYDGAFYKNATTGVNIRTPYSLVAGNNTGTMTSTGQPAQTYICNVTNAPYGSRQGFVNYIVNVSRVCAQNDWDCINKAVVDSCAQYESDPTCTMTEEKRDGVLSYQFGQNTPYVRTNQLCFGVYSEHLGGLPVTDPKVGTPSWVPAEYSTYAYQPVDIGQANPFWQTCGNFRTISRNYVCTEGKLERLGINVPAFSENVRQGLEIAAQANFDSPTDTLTSYTYRTTDPTTGAVTATSRPTNIPFVPEGTASSCVQSCVVLKKASTRVYSDGHTRGSIGDCAAGTGPGTIHPCVSQQAPVGATVATPTGQSTSVRADGTVVVSQGSMSNFLGQDIANLAIAPATEKEVRTCEQNLATNTFTCPVNSAFGETIEPGKDCQCLNLLGEALSYTAMMREVSQDITCGEKRPTPAGQQIERVDNYLVQQGLKSTADCGDGGQSEVKYVCGWADPALGTGNRLECGPTRVDSQRILDPIKVRTWTSDNYECLMSWADHDEVFINLGGLNPKTAWFDYCYNNLKEDGINFVLTSPDVNDNHPPLLNFCSPAATPYTGSKPSCGYDVWTLNAGSPTRSDVVGLSPLSTAPFGYVNMNFKISRQYDCTVQMGASDGNVNDNTSSVGEWYVGPATPNGPIDCNNDGWLDYFNCTWRSTGYDCNKDCISDNSLAYCNQITGWDCHRGDGCDRAEYASCSWRSAGYDYNGDFIADATTPTACSGSATNIACGTVDCGLTNSCNSCGSCTTYQCNPVETCSAWSDAIVTTSCTPSNTVSCNGPHAWPGGDYLGTYYPPGTYWLMSTRTCSTTYSTCYTCPKVCTGSAVSAGWDCLGDARADYPGSTDCAAVSGADCGINGGAIANQSPDGCIDNNMQYCAHVTQGWDCNTQGWAGSNNGIDAGTCNTPANRADSECVKGPLKCSRTTHPSNCCLDVENIVERVDIRNDDGNEYTCNLKYEPTSREIKQISYNDPGTAIDDEQKFLSEGCVDKWVEVYQQGTVAEQEYKYFRYEDLVHMIASDTSKAPRCDARDPQQYCYCKDDPFRAAGNTNFIQVRDLQNSGMELK